MTSGLIGRKLGMTRVFSEDGTAVPVGIRAATAQEPLDQPGRPLQFPADDRRP